MNDENQPPLAPSRAQARCAITEETLEVVTNAKAPRRRLVGNENHYNNPIPTKAPGKCASVLLIGTKRVSDALM